MTVHIIEELSGPNVKCGGTCKKNLPESSIWLAVIFDELHELPVSLKQGQVNIVKCPTCQYEGNLWKGFLAIDKTRERVVGVSTFVESSDWLKDSFERIWTLCREKDPSLSQNLWSDLVLLERFDSLNQLITMPEDHFEAEVIDTRDFLERVELTDLPKRAENCFRQLLNRQQLIRFDPKGRERSSYFYDLLYSQAKTAVSVTDCDEKTEKVANMILDTFEPHLSPNYIDHGILSDPADNQDNLDWENGVYGKVAGEDNTTAAPKELIAFINKLTKSFTPSKTQCPEDISEFIELILLLKSVSPNPLPPAPDSPAIYKQSLQQASERLIRALPDKVINRPVEDPDKGKQPFKEFILHAASTAKPNELSFIHQIALREIFANKNESNELALASANFFIQISKELGSLDAVLCAMVTAGQYLGHCRNLEEMPLQMYVSGLDLFYQTQKSNNDLVAIFSELGLAIGLAWESVASYCIKTEQPGAAAMAASLAKSIFFTHNRRDGAFAVSITLVSSLIELNKLSQQQVEEFEKEFSSELKHAVEHVTELSDNVFDSVINYLMLRAVWQFRKDVSDTAFVCGIKEIPDNTDNPIFENEKLIILDPGLLFDLGERQYSLARIYPKPFISEFKPGDELAPDFVNFHDIKGEHLAEFPKDANNICEYQLLIKPNHPPYVFLAQFIGSMWVYRLGMALDFAIQRKNYDYHIKIWATLVNLLNQFPNTGILYYFTRCIEVCADAMGFDERLVRICTLSGLSGRIRQYTMSGLDPTSSPQLVKAVDKIIKSFEKDPLAYLVNFSSIKMDSALEILAEIFESMGHYSHAFSVSALRAKNLFEKKPSNFSEYYDYFRQNGDFRPLYRAARALKKIDDPSTQQDVWRIELGEICKISSQKIHLKQMSVNDKSEIEQVLSTLPVRVSDLASLIPIGSAIIHFTLLHDTDLNDGCWQIAIFAPHNEFTSIIVDPSLNEVHEAVEQANEALESARNLVKGKCLSEVTDALKTHHQALDPLLKQLSELVLPKVLCEAILSGKINRIFVIPEAYIYDVPWNALPLSVNSQNIPIGLYRHKGMSLTISILPNFVAFKTKHSEHSNSNMVKPKVFSAALTTNVPWNNSYARIRAVRKRILHSIEQLADTHNLTTEKILIENATVISALEDISRSDIFMFFGHGDILESGASLVMQDGVISNREIESSQHNFGLHNKLTIIMACSGINSAPKHMGRELSGVHVGLINAGVRCVVGSVQPVFPISAILTTEFLLDNVNKDQAVDRIVAAIRQRISQGSSTSHPVFWSGLITFGVGTDIFALAEEN